MTLTRKLALALCLAFSFITLSSNAQVDSTTGNLINYGTTPTDTTSKWNNGVYVNQLGCFGGNSGTGYCGPNPNVQTSGNINFSYGQVDLNQVVNINKALTAGGTGVQLSGFNFGFMAKNGNGWDDGRQDYLSAYVKFYNAGGGLAANYDYTSQTNRKYNWTQFNFSETFANPSAATNYSNAQVGFVGRDNNYWAGPYGPEIYNVSFSLKYRVDPCATNPAYSSTCAGFNNVINTPNLFNSSQGGGSLNQAFAINTALGLAGSGAMVHGLNYGFNYTVGQGFSGCTATNQDGSCSWYMNTPAYVSASMTLRNSDNQVINQKNYSFAQEGTSGSVSEKYLLPSSMNQTLLGTARLTASSSGTGSSVSGAWANIIYTADPCTANPLYSTSCSGYGAAFAKSLASTTSTTSLTQTTLPLSNPPMDNSGPLVSDGSFGATSPMAGPPPGSTPPPGSEPPPSSQVASNPPGSPPPPGAAPNPAQGPGPTATASTSAGPVQRQEGGKAGGGNLSLALSVVSRVQAADKATQNAAVANAQQVVATSSAAAQEQANQVVDQANALSAESSQASQTLSASTTQSTSSQQSNAGSVGGLQGPNVMSVQTLTASALQSASTGSSPYVAPSSAQLNDSSNSQSPGSLGLPLQMPQPVQQSQDTTTPSSVYVAPAANQTSDTLIVQSTNSQGLPLQAPPKVEQAQVATTQASVYVPPVANQTSEIPVAQSKSSQGLPLQAPQVVEQAQIIAPMQSTYQTPVINSETSIYSLTSSTPIRSNQGMTLNSQAPTVVAMVTPQLIQQRQEFKFETRTEQEQPQVYQPQQTALTRGSVINDILEQRLNTGSMQMEQQMDTVKKNVLPNELAGGVDIASIAMVPKGYETYSIVTLRDIPFYRAEPIYKDQRTVDNARVFRGLTGGSDAKHQEMVNQQYKIGN
jgi:hypothetical protein